MNDEEIMRSIEPSLKSLDKTYTINFIQSPINNSTYNLVFQNAWRVIAASMIAYLFAQFIDKRIFHFWKKLTKGKHLWLRNNGSTIASQLVDTTLVVSIYLLAFGIQIKFSEQLLMDGCSKCFWL